MTRLLMVPAPDAASTMVDREVARSGSIHRQRFPVTVRLIERPGKTIVGLLATAGFTALVGCGFHYEGEEYVTADASSSREGSPLIASDRTLADPLFAAAANGDVGALRSALASGRRPETRGGYGMTPLMLAAKNGHRPAAGILLDSGAKIASKNVRGENAIYLAADAEETRMVSFLVDRGADVNSSNSIGFTPLFLAARSGDLRFVDVLLAKGADPRKRSTQGGCALRLAAIWAHWDVARRLLEAGADADNRNSSGTSPLWSMCTLPTQQSLKRPQDRLKVARLLLQHGADPNVASTERRGAYRGATPLMGSAQQGHADLVALLIASGADVNARSAEGATPLNLARRNRHGTVVRLLIAAGARG